MCSMDRVAAKIAIEIRVLLQHDDSMPERARRKLVIIPAGPPPTMTQRV
jgi:hypothetical protein